MKATNISNVTLVENYLLFCQTWEVISKPFMNVSHKDYKCGSCEKLITGATSLRIHIKTIHEDHKDFDLIGTKALAKEIKCQLFFL